MNIILSLTSAEIAAAWVAGCIESGVSLTFIRKDLETDEFSKYHILGEAEAQVEKMGLHVIRMIAGLLQLANPNEFTKIQLIICRKIKEEQTQ